jgi:hypothetical protein
MALRSQRLSNPEFEPLPTISFYCACGKRLYTVSTNVLALNGSVDCKKCGRHYEFQDSIIAGFGASSVSSSLEKAVPAQHLKPEECVSSRTENIEPEFRLP